MSTRELWKHLPDWRAFGPYLLIELILPGGTLVAFLLWLSQRLRGLRIDHVHRAPKDYHHAVLAPHCAALPEREGSDDAIEDRPCRQASEPADGSADLPCCKERWRGCVAAAIV